MFIKGYGAMFSDSYVMCTDINKLKKNTTNEMLVNIDHIISIFKTEFGDAVLELKGTYDGGGEDSLLYSPYYVFSYLDYINLTHLLLKKGVLLGFRF
ncbi:MAG: hypothetical protein HN929_00035 [Chloroflexi bacterium]|jgi:hypothetical protein|nr:hypothetical protein [Chloroflexota bacterium]